MTVKVTGDDCWVGILIRTMTLFFMSTPSNGARPFANNLISVRARLVTCRTMRYVLTTGTTKQDNSNYCLSFKNKLLNKFSGCTSAHVPVALMIKETGRLFVSVGLTLND